MFAGPSPHYNHMVCKKKDLTMSVMKKGEYSKQSGKVTYILMCFHSYTHMWQL